MKTLKLLMGVMILSFVMLFSSCDCGSKDSKCETSSTETLANEGNLEVDPDHTAENSLDWEGIYHGVLPCASCEGIDTELVIKYDNTFVYTTKYLGGDEEVVVAEGKITWTDGSIIELNIDNSQNVFFQVGENYLELRDVEANKIESEHNLRLEKIGE